MKTAFSYRLFDQLPPTADTFTTPPPPPPPVVSVRLPSLHQLVSRGDTDALEQRLFDGADVNATDGKGATALHVAASFPYQWSRQSPHGCLKLLLAQPHVNIHIRDHRGRTPFDKAVLTGDLTVRDKLRDHAMWHLNAEHSLQHYSQFMVNRPSDYSTLSPDQLMVDLFMWFLSRQNITWPTTAKIQLLLAMGYKLRTEDNMGRTVLNIMCSNCSDRSTYSVDQLRLLLKAGANTCNRDHRGRTPLLNALKNGRWRFAQVLIEVGADVNAQTFGGKSCLEVRPDMPMYLFRLLLQHGFRINATLNNGFINAKVVDLINKPEYIDVVMGALERDGYAFNHIDRDGNTWLHLFADDSRVLPRLLPYYVAYMDTRRSDGLTALDLAADFDHIDNIKLLLAHGADVSNYQFSGGDYCMYVATDHTRTAMARTLAMAGALCQHSSTMKNHVRARYGQLSAATYTQPRFEVMSCLDMCSKYIQRHMYLLPPTLSQRQQVLPQDLLERLTQPVIRRTTQQWQRAVLAALE